MVVGESTLSRDLLETGCGRCTFRSQYQSSRRFCFIRYAHLSAQAPTVLIPPLLVAQGRSGLSYTPTVRFYANSPPCGSWLVRVSHGSSVAQ